MAGSSRPTPPPLEPTVEQYMARIAADDQAAMHAIRVDADGLPTHIGPFPSPEAAFAWNDRHRDGADCVVVTLHAPWRPHREPRRAEG